MPAPAGSRRPTVPIDSIEFQQTSVVVAAASEVAALKRVAQKVLAYLHILKDVDVVETTIRAFHDQTYPISKILLVDNASTDGPLGRAFPSSDTIIGTRKTLAPAAPSACGMPSRTRAISRRAASKC